ncbi:MAG: protein phosphatase 2C domain-containing protein [bacterium]
MEKDLTIIFDCLSDRGLKRADNQDAHGKFPIDDSAMATPKGQLFIVADGIGGHAGGKEASRMAVDIVQQIYFAEQSHDIPQTLRRAMETANAQIYQSASSRGPEFHGMGTTCTALAFKDDRVYVAHVGDSRAYRITKSRIEQLTQDHSKVAEMQRFGILTAEEAKRHPQKSYLVRALGIAPAVRADIIADLSPLRPGECFLLCTDGLAKVEAHEIQRLVMHNHPTAVCRALIELANARGGSDNATVQVIAIVNAVS